MWVLSLVLAALSLLLLALNWSDPSAHVFDYWVENAILATVFSTVGAVVASRRPDHPVGWLFCAIGFIGGLRLLGAWYMTYTLLAQHGELLGGWVATWLSSWVWAPHIGLFVFLGLLFPDGKLPSPLWRPFAWLVAVVVVVGTVVGAISPGPIRGFEPLQNPLGIEGIPNATDLIEALIYILGVVAAASVSARLRRARGVQRQQIKWFAYATVMLAVSANLTYVVSETINIQWLRWVGFVPAMVALAGLPVAMGIAILRYRLYNIDLIINRTMVYGALSASVVSLYVLIVWALGIALAALFQARGGLAVSLVATGVVAVLFAPLRERLQRGVNRLMYGDRDEPYAVLSRLGRRLEATIAPEATLSTIVETVAQALKLPYVSIELEQDGRFQRMAERGSRTGELVILPLVYQRETVGRLILTPWGSGETFSPADRRLLEDVARQAEVAVHAVRLTAELQHSRERLVAAREEERRRLRRDLHDGLGPTLGGLTLGLDAARGALTRDPSTAAALLWELKVQTQEAVSDVRRLVYGLRPPALDDLGLIAAVRQQAAKHGLLTNDLLSGARGRAGSKNGLVFQVEAPDDLPPLPAAVEVACYRIVQEAMTNVARHAGARSCRVGISTDGAESALELEVIDDGVGIPEERRAGVGMSSMRERAEELGGTLSIESVPAGGTRVVARLPLPAKEK